MKIPLYSGISVFMELGLIQLHLLMTPAQQSKGPLRRNNDFGKVLDKGFLPVDIFVEQTCRNALKTKTPEHAIKLYSASNIFSRVLVLSVGLAMFCNPIMAAQDSKSAEVESIHEFAWLLVSAVVAFTLIARRSPRRETNQVLIRATNSPDIIINQSSATVTPVYSE